MTAAVRKTPDIANSGTDVGIPYTTLVDTEIEALWSVASTWLTSVGGSANAITASSDAALVAAITVYVRPLTFWLVPASSNTSTVTINIDGVGAKPVVDKDNVSLAAGALIANRLHELVYDGTSFRVFSSSPPSNPPTPAPDMIVQEQWPTSTNGGNGATFTAGSPQTRLLNTVVRNVIAGASLATNQITLPAGTYAAEWSAPAQEVGSHATRLFNVTDSATIVGGVGTSEICPSGTANIQTRSFGKTVFTLSSSKVIRLDHQCLSTKTLSGFGVATTFSAYELYAYVNIWKTA